jgi:hypothetical protein
MGDDVTQEQAFAHANDVLKNGVGGHIHNSGDIIHIPGAGEKSTLKTSRPLWVSKARQCWVLQWLLVRIAPRLPQSKQLHVHCWKVST